MSFFVDPEFFESPRTPRFSSFIMASRKRRSDDSESKSTGSKKGGKRVVALDKSGHIPARFIPQSMRTEVKRFINPAFWDAETLDNPTAGASAYLQFANIAQGAAVNQRIGDAVYIKRISVRWWCAQSVSALFSPFVLAFVEDTEPAAGAPNWSDVFQSIGAASLAAYMNPQLNNDQRFRFRLKRLVRVEMDIKAIGAASTSSAHVHGEMSFPINKLIKFNGAGGIYRGSNWILFGWSQLAANTPQITASFATSYTDA